MIFAGMFQKVKKLTQPEIDELNEELYAAAERGDLDAVKELHTGCVHINHTDVNFGPALFAAAKENQAPVVEYLLELKADVSLTNIFNQTGLHCAIREGADNVIPLKLIAAAAPVNGRDKHGATPSFYAAQTANAEVLEALAQKSADFTIANNKGVTPLMQATMASHTDAIDVLTKYPCALDQQDEDKRTALMHAVICRNAPLVEKYLSLGANFDLKDKDGETALALAKRLFNRKEIVEMLEQADAARIQPFRTGTENSVTIMKRLVLKGASA